MVISLYKIIYMGFLSIGENRKKTKNLGVELDCQVPDHETRHHHLRIIKHYLPEGGIGGGTIFSIGLSDFK